MATRSGRFYHVGRWVSAGNRTDSATDKTGHVCRFTHLFYAISPRLDDPYVAAGRELQYELTASFLDQTPNARHRGARACERQVPSGVPNARRRSTSRAEREPGRSQGIARLVALATGLCFLQSS